jgi:hypothetical protein
LEKIGARRRFHGSALSNLLWLKWCVTRNSYERLLRRPRGRVVLAGLGFAFLIEVAVFLALVSAVRMLQASSFAPPGDFAWTSAALLPLYLMLLLPSATGVELQTQIDARKLLPYPMRLRDIFLGAAAGRAFGLLFPFPFLLPPVAAALMLAQPPLEAAPVVFFALVLTVFQGIFLSQVITVAFQSSVGSRRLRDAAAFVSVFIVMLLWAALQLWVFGSLGSREDALARLSQGNLPPILASHVLSDPLSAGGAFSLALLAGETAATFVAGVLISYFLLVLRVPSKAAAHVERKFPIPQFPMAAHSNLLLWKDRIYLRRDPFVKAASYGTLVLILVAIVSAASTRAADPRVIGGFFLTLFAFLAPWTFLVGLGANLLGVEDGLPFLLSTPIDRRAFLRAKAVFLIAMSTLVSGLTLAGCAVVFDRLDLVPTAVSFTFVISVGLTAAAMVSSAYFPSHTAREGFRRKTVSGTGLLAFSLVGILYLIPVAIASGVPALVGNRLFLLATIPAALAVEFAFLRTSVEVAARRLALDEGEVLLRVKG